MRSIVTPEVYEFDAEGHLVRMEEESDEQYLARTATVLHQEGLSSNDPAVVIAQYDTPVEGENGLSITELAPDTAEVGGDDVTMYINGTGFTDQTVINFNGGEEPTTLVNAECVSTLVKASIAGTAGTFPVFVTDGGVQSNSLEFTFADPVSEDEEEETSRGSSSKRSRRGR